jgi:hypothetical protein
MADLPLMFECREHVGAAQQFEVGLGAVTADFFEQCLEANHGNRCLNVIIGVGLRGVKKTAFDPLDSLENG